MDMKNFAELEARLNFRYLPQIAFETPEAQEEVRAKGIEKYQRNEVTAQELELGELYHKEILAGYVADVSIRPEHENVGFGAFAEAEIPSGSYVGEYTGIVRKNDRRHFEPLNNYCYEYPVPDEIGRSYVVDATSGNLTRFINHSYTPNLKPFHVFYDGFYHLIFVSLGPIKRGTQLAFDYGRNYWYIRCPPLELYRT
jgi:hypothetical protein